LIGGSLVEASSNGDLYNTTVAFAPTGELDASYRKIHLFGYESAEARLLSPGREVGLTPSSGAWA
jgi:predicted amidohydrolase